MQISVNPDGTRNRDFRPYIDQEELHRNVTLYDPHGPGHNYGLYSSAQPQCNLWVDHFRSAASRTPASVVDRTGRQHLVRPCGVQGYHHGNCGAVHDRSSRESSQTYQPLMRSGYRYWQAHTSCRKK